MNLLAYFQCLSELLPDNQRMDIGKVLIYQYYLLLLLDFCQKSYLKFDAYLDGHCN